MSGTNVGSLISVPKGGGALGGLGEKFAPDLHTGTGSFAVPITLPPGRNRFQPELSLVYSTGQGNGPFGLGWSLSVPGVSRKTSRGIPTYDDSQDVFILAGAEDLVPVEAGGGAVRYRPRTEGLFARIVHHRDGHDDYWEVRNKNGLTSVYGTPGRADDDPATVAERTADRARVFAWKQTRAVDLFGNRIEYGYERDLVRTEGPHRWDQIYLSTIRYVDHGDADDPRFLVTVTFVYEARPDPFSEYRAGFEVRTVRRCTRIEVRTHAGVDRLTRTYRLVYLDSRDVPARELPLNGASLLSEIRVTGWDAERSEELPPLTFGHTRFEPEDRRFSAVQGAELPPRSLADGDFELVDLFGRGLPDILEMNESVRYWRNLGDGRFDRPREMRDAPAGLRLSDKGVQLIDADGDGRPDLMVTAGPLTGYYPLRFGGRWDRRSFRRYEQAPSFDLDDPDVRLVDLDGDGVTDAIRSGARLECFFNDPRRGWIGTRAVERRALSEFPDVDFSDPRVKWADMTGDGLTDIAVVHAGRVEYWPALGRGSWGRRVSMLNGPRLPDGYDPARVLLGDLDGDGAADLAYVDDHMVTVWINQSGNRWSEPIEVKGTPPVSDLDAVRLIDVLGTGVAGILWSTDAGSRSRATMSFLDLTGGVKPYLLDVMDNHMGAVTRVEYAPSTRFAVEDDARPATRWTTPLPFAVQVVARVEVVDEISTGKLTREYRYHHGYWDGVEREFRGFGMVEQLDTETFAAYHAPGLHGQTNGFQAVDTPHFSPPTLTRTWFHQGAIGDEFGGWEETSFGHQFWAGDPAVLARPAAMTAWLDRLPRGARRDALRALRGRVLRTELYALDGTDLRDRPYTVTESLSGLREVEEEAAPPAGAPERPRIFFPHPLAERTTQWERGTDPMTGAVFTGDYDRYGQARSVVDVAVPRGRQYGQTVPPGAPAPPAYLATHVLTDFAQRDDERYLVDRVARTTTYDIPNDGREALLGFASRIASGALDDPRRCIGQTLNFYDRDDTEPDHGAFRGRPFGQLGDYGAVARTESLVLTDDILRDAYGNAVPPYLRRRNVALAANGATATASSTYGPEYPPTNAINGDRFIVSGRGFGYWTDAARDAAPDWFQVDFAGVKTIDEVDVFSYQDVNPPVEPTESMTFTRNGLIEFEIERWDGSAWVAVPGTRVVDNDKIWRKVTFTPITTSKIRLVMYRSFDMVCRLVEIEAYGTDEQGWPEYPEDFRARLPVSQLSDPTRPGLVMTPAGYGFTSGGGGYARGFFAAADRRRYDFHADPEGKGRGLVEATRGPLGQDAITTYDAYRLLPATVTDPGGLTTRADYDYRALQPAEVTDPNGNRRGFTYTPLGFLQDSWVRGNPAKVEGDRQRPSVRMEYDFHAFARSPAGQRQPTFVRTIKHVHHDTEEDVEPPVRDATITAVQYSDGFGRVLQTRTQGDRVRFGDPVFGGGPAVLPISQADGPGGDVTGTEHMDTQHPWVVVSGWQVYDNKGRVVQRYEPFFSDGWEYARPTDAQRGQKAIVFHDPRGQVIRTLNADGSEQRVIYGVPTDLTRPQEFTPTPWEAYTYDANDNAGRTHPAISTRYQEHWNTPASVRVDALGRTVETAARVGASATTDRYRTRATYDIRGNLVAAIDTLGRVAFRYVYDLANRPLRIESLDAGTRQSVLDAGGNALESRDSKGALVLHACDGQSRPIRRWARDGSGQPLTLRERLVHGDGPDAGLTQAQAMAVNLLGRIYRHWDEAGLLTSAAYDFKGNVLDKRRQVVADSAILEVFASPAPDWRIDAFRVNWEPVDATALDATEYRTTVTYDALERVKTLQYPEDVEGTRRSLRPRYNAGGSLERVEIDGTTYVARIAYDAKGQRTLVAYGNGVMTRHAYDPRTWRLARMRSEQYTTPTALTYHPSGPVLADHAYRYDLNGNVLEIVERTPGCGVLDNPDAAQVGDPELAQLLVAGDALIRRFEYDPLSRLRLATGRQSDDIPSPRPWSDDPRRGFNSGQHGAPTQDNAPGLSTLYREEYAYDPAGNVVSLAHRTSAGSWVRHFGMGGLTPQQWSQQWPSHVATSEEWTNPPGNRLTHVGDDSPTVAQTHVFDANGNLVRETAARGFEWDAADHLRAYRTQVDGAEPSVYAHYLYDAGGQRVKKLVRRQGGGYEVTVAIDGAFEHQRIVSGATTRENNTLHVLDNQQRLALVRIGAPFPDDATPAVKYHLADHLGSSTIVLDADGAWINREEYFPYGETGFGSFARKRYRFTGKERDEESGLYYHVQRYYAPSLARWTSCDPIASLNLYLYGRGNPMAYNDPSGCADLPAVNPFPTNSCDAHPRQCYQSAETASENAAQAAERARRLGNSAEKLNTPSEAFDNWPNAVPKPAPSPASPSLWTKILAALGLATQVPSDTPSPSAATTEADEGEYYSRERLTELRDGALARQERKRLELPGDPGSSSAVELPGGDSPPFIDPSPEKGGEIEAPPATPARPVEAPATGPATPLEAAKKPDPKFEGVRIHKMIEENQPKGQYEGGWELWKQNETVGGTKRPDEVWVNHLTKNLVIVDTYTGGKRDLLTPSGYESLAHNEKGWGYCYEPAILKLIADGYSVQYMAGTRQFFLVPKHLH